MNNLIESTRLTLIDFIGSFIPGMAWASLLFCTLFALRHGRLPCANEAISPTRMALGESLLVVARGASVPGKGELARGSKSFAPMDPLVAAERPLADGTILVATSLALGYLSKIATTDLLDPVLCPIVRLLMLCRNHLRRRRERWGHPRFPYRGSWPRAEKFLSRLLRRQVPVSPKGTHPGLPFAYWKRVMLVRRSPLHADSVQLEAEVRMCASLCFASLGAVMLAAIFPGPVGGHQLAWEALVISLLFALAYARRRREEIKFTYLNALVFLAEEGRTRRSVSRPITR